MNGDWRLIGQGLALATLGAGGSMLYIIALSAYYIGRYWTANFSSIAAIGAAAVFLRLLPGYLAAIERPALTRSPPTVSED
jgi:hypothetical protein